MPRRSWNNFGVCMDEGPGWPGFIRGSATSAISVRIHRGSGRSTSFKRPGRKYGLNNERGTRSSYVQATLNPLRLIPARCSSKLLGRYPDARSTFRRRGRFKWLQREKHIVIPLSLGRVLVDFSFHRRFRLLFRTSTSVSFADHEGKLDRINFRFLQIHPSWINLSLPDRILLTLEQIAFERFLGRTGRSN